MRKSKQRRGHGSGVRGILTGLIMLCSVLLTTAAYAQPSQVLQDVEQLANSVKERPKNGNAPAKEQSTEKPRISVTDKGYAKHLGAPPDHYFPVRGIVPGNSEITARNFIKENKRVFGIMSSKVEFALLKMREKNSRRYHRFQQTYAGIPVFGGQVIIQLNDINGVEYAGSDIARDLGALDNGTVPVIPAIRADEAAQRVIDHFKTRNSSAAINASVPELKIFSPELLDDAGPVRLVWDMNITSDDSLSLNKQILLDAHTGEMVREYPLYYSALNREIYDANNVRGTDPGTLRRKEGDSSSGIVDVDDAYSYLEDSYSYYSMYHQRDSVNCEQGQWFCTPLTLSATVRYCTSNTKESCPYPNAFWSGSKNRIYFGEGYASADDIVGHEYTHGVTQYESNLVYEKQSGAINESLSDIFGEFIDQLNNAGTDSSSAKWKLAEDLPDNQEGWRGAGTCSDLWDNDSDGRIDLSDPDCIMRDMSDPPAKGQPDRLSGSNWVNTDGCTPSDTNDYCGVHTNSGVGNKLAYLLTDGGTFNGWTISSGSRAAVSELFYEANMNLLASTSNYYDLYHALRQAAVNLSWTTAKKNDLYRACKSVNIVDSGRDLYVDKGNLCVVPNGNPTCVIAGGPYKSISEGANAANPGDTLHIKTGTYNETVIDKIMDLRSWGGEVVIKK